MPLNHHFKNASSCSQDIGKNSTTIHNSSLEINCWKIRKIEKQISCSNLIVINKKTQKKISSPCLKGENRAKERVILSSYGTLLKRTGKILDDF